MPWSHLVDMAHTDDERDDMPMTAENRPVYPYGLRICLTGRELELLELDADCEVGDYIDLRAFASVTSISKTDGPDGPSCRVELQIEKIAIEREDDMDDE